MCVKCDTKDSNGDYDPCCGHSGYCEAYYTDGEFSSCICCGAAMQKDESGAWRHYSQMSEPLENRYTAHFMQEKQK